jgi:hypothetical protein
MNVTQRFCADCEGEGKLVDIVERAGEGPERGLPASAMQDTEEDRPVKFSASYTCDECGGEGFYFYIEDEDRYGQTLRRSELPPNARLFEISGPAEWIEQQTRKPVLPLAPGSNVGRRA